MNELSSRYWQNRYENEEIGWDIGSVSSPLRNFFDSLENKELKILIPGAGNAYEAEYLFKNGFSQVHLLDWANSAIQNFKERNPDFPEQQLFCQDFFKHEEQYDLIIEQTFFCALNPELRENYVLKMFQLLKPEGRIAGLLFNRVFEKQGPPFGGIKEEYEILFSEYFNLKILDECYNSIPPRAGSELFFVFEKKNII